MSHFTVLVIGPDHEKQLQPFHEFECTGTNDEFVQDVDVTAECREHGIDYHGLEDQTVRSDAEIDRDGEHKYGYAIVDAEGSLVKAVKRTNPNKKWDWYQIGGRWSGFLKLKPGAKGSVGEDGLMGSHFAKGDDRADQAHKRDIDFSGMRDDAGNKAGALWDKAHAVIAGRTWQTWEAARDAHPGNIEQARASYHAQAAVSETRAALDGDLGIFSGVDQFLVSREQYVQEARDKACAPFAVVYRGEWSEKGRMGWFACVSDEKPQGDWNRLVNDLIDGLPDDTMLTVVDCHI